MRTTRNRAPSENADAVGLIIALLVRFPHVATLVSHPSEGTLTLSFALGRRLDPQTERAVRELVLEHVRSFAELAGEMPEVLEVACEVDERLSFIRVTRDARSLCREELQLLTGLLAEQFGDALLVSPAADDGLEDDPVAQDELVEYALEALRDPTQQKSLVGFREEKRVLVYFVAARKKAKARARS